MQLTAHQQAAFDELLLHIEQGEMCCLKGYAGTGKTTLIGQLVDELLEREIEVYACTPTHKAAQVLQSKIGKRGVSVGTIHSFLGLKLVRDNKGGYVLKPSGDTAIPEWGVVIVDEASMVGMDLWPYIVQAAWLTWVFVGDPAQLPPVNEEPSAVFDLPGPELEEVVRQARDNPIIDFATRVREGDARARSGWKGGIGVALTRNTDHFVERAVVATEMLGADARLLCYRNVTVEAYNRSIRTAIFGDNTPRFVEGDRLMARDAFFDEKGVLRLQNSAEVDVLAAEEKPLDLREYGKWETWEVTFFDPFGRIASVPVLHEKEQGRYERTLKSLRDSAIDGKRSWKLYYGLRERFARLDYAFAMTVHKAQGSTFDTAFVDWNDLRYCRSAERLALMYVAATRPSRRLALRV